MKDGPSSVLSEGRTVSLCVCGEQFKENKTLKRNLSEGEESWHNDDKMLLLDLTRNTAV